MKHLGLTLFLFGCAASSGAPADGHDPGDHEPDAASSAPDAPVRHDAALDRSRAPDTAVDHPSVPDTAAPDGPSAFAAVQAILDQNCIRCHTSMLPPRPDLFGYPMLPLTPDVAYRNLVGKMGLEKCGGVLVAPGDAAHSYLYRKLTENPPCDGKRMPSPGMLATAPPLPADQIAIIRAWIQAGAPP
jgi:mono/diheme cytochrome c family protein